MLCFLACDDSKGNGGEIDIKKPLLLSSTPSNEEKNVGTGDVVIVLTFDQNVTLVNPSEITLNNENIVSATAAFKELKISVTLEKATQYKLLVPAGKIKGPTGLLADKIEINFTTRGSLDETISKTLCTSNPSSEAQNIYGFLRENFGEKIISGAMANVSWNTNEADWIYKHTGKYPALNCLDYVHLYASPANWINYENTEVAEKWWANNGLLAAMWHWNVPTSEGNSTYNFYTDKTSFNAANAVIDGSYENNIVKADLNKIADNLLLLKEKNIPIIWRPFHEASGGWFWWGAKGAEPCKKLWIMMFEIFEAKGLNNLIWVWTSQTNDYEWYPGDDYVDIIGCDIYNKNSVTDIYSMFESIRDDYPNKMLALSEFGNVSKLSDQWNAGAKWLWMMPWYDYDRTVNPSSNAFNETTHQHANISYWQNVLDAETIITRDEMPDLK